MHTARVRHQASSIHNAEVAEAQRTQRDFYCDFCVVPDEVSRSDAKIRDLEKDAAVVPTAGGFAGEIPDSPLRGLPG